MMDKIMILGDSISAPTGFATSGRNIAWCLADEYDVYYLGYQSTFVNKVNITAMGETRTVTEIPNMPRPENAKWSFGEMALPHALKKYRPDIVLSITDIQMTAHIPKTLFPTVSEVPIFDPATKQFENMQSIKDKIDRDIRTLREQLKINPKFVYYAPMDGEPPIPDWAEVYYTADKLIAFSKYGQRIFKEYYNIDCPYIYHGVDTVLFDKKEKNQELKNKFVVGDIHRNQPRKQPVRLIEAFAEFAKDKDDVLLILHKDWRDFFGWDLYYFINQYRLYEKVYPPPPDITKIPYNTLPNLISQFDVNMNITGGEGFNIPMIEGFACGKPAIATGYTTHPELIEDGNPSPRGLLTKFIFYWDKLNVSATKRSLVDIDDAVNKLNEYYYDRKKLSKHGENAYRWVRQNCSLNVIEKKWKKEIKEVLDGESMHDV